MTEDKEIAQYDLEKGLRWLKKILPLYFPKTRLDFYVTNNLLTREPQKIGIEVHTALSPEEFRDALRKLSNDGCNHIFNFEFLQSPPAEDLPLFPKEEQKDEVIKEKYFTIQYAIDAANNGDIVVLPDGVYRGEGNQNLDFDGKTITVLSENGPENCIIDLEGFPLEFNPTGKGKFREINICDGTYRQMPFAHVQLMRKGE